MAYHGVLIPEAIAATNIDAYNRSAVCSASSIDNGFVLTLTGKNSGSISSGSGTEVWNAIAPVTGSLSSLWMAYEAEIVVTDSRYKGIDPDVRNFFNATSKVFSVFKPQVGDIILATAECFKGTVASAYAVAANGDMQLNWLGTGAAGMTWKFLATKYISLATGGIDTQRVAAYELECLSN